MKESYEQIRKDGLMGLRESARPVYNKVLQQGRHLQPEGTNIYARNWDLIIILDACSLDLMQEVADSYDAISTIDSIWSLDSMTAQWMERTFVDQFDEEISKTAYICGNPFSTTKLSGQDFERLVEVWQYDWLNIGTVPPRAVTNWTIETARNGNADRIIAHYMQPHCPFIPNPEMMESKDLDKWSDQDSKDVWEQLRDDELTKEEVWEGYRSNLEYVLDELELLLNNVDADRVVITSDHGNAMGQWFIYGHPPMMPLQCLREVPWIETRANDSGEYEPSIETKSVDSTTPKMRLRALGYTE